MLPRLWHLTKRHRWPLAAALLTSALLWFWFQPRPVAQYRLPPEVYVYHMSSMLKSLQISPSGKYLAFTYYFDSTVHLYELEGMKWLFKQKCIDRDSARFDDQDGLAFASFATIPRHCNIFLI